MQVRGLQCSACRTAAAAGGAENRATQGGGGSGGRGGAMCVRAGGEGLRNLPPPHSTDVAAVEVPSATSV